MTRPLSFRTPRLAKSLAVIFLALLGAIAGGCQSTKHVDAAPVNEVPAGSFGRKWIADLGLKGDQATDVFVRDDLVIIYTRNHVAYVLDRESGGSRAQG